MALQDFTLLAKLEALDIESHKIVKRFERSEKHVLSAEIRQTMASILHLVIRAAKTGRPPQAAPQADKTY